MVDGPRDSRSSGRYCACVPASSRAPRTRQPGGEKGQTVAATVVPCSSSRAAISRIVIRCVEVVRLARRGSSRPFSGWRGHSNCAITRRPPTPSRRHSQVVRRGSADPLALEIDMFRLDRRNSCPSNAREDPPVRYTRGRSRLFVVRNGHGWTVADSEGITVGSQWMAGRRAAVPILIWGKERPHATFEPACRPVDPSPAGGCESD